MIFFTRTIPVNEPGEPVVNRQALWSGMTAEAHNALPYLVSANPSKVTEWHSATAFTREIEAPGGRFAERVELEEQHRVVLTRLTGPVLGTLTNEIVEQDGGLGLKVLIELTAPGSDSDSDAEREHVDRAAQDHLRTADAMLRAIRNLVADQRQPQARQIGTIMSDWITHYYADIDGMRLQSYVSRHDKDAVMVFGNNQPYMGHQAIAEAMALLWSMLDGMRHERRNLWYVDDCDTAILESNVHYRTKTGKEFAVPSMSVLERGANGLVTTQRVYVDLTPLFAEMNPTIQDRKAELDDSTRSH